MDGRRANLGLLGLAWKGAVGDSPGEKDPGQHTAFQQAPTLSSSIVAECLHVYKEGASDTIKT